MTVYPVAYTFSPCYAYDGINRERYQCSIHYNTHFIARCPDGLKNNKRRLWTGQRLQIPLDAAQSAAGDPGGVSCGAGGEERFADGTDGRGERESVKICVICGLDF
jgi:hypothetical protein